MADRLDIECAAATDVLARHQGAHLVHAAFGDQPALGHHRDAVGQGFGFFEVMRGQDHRASFRDEAPDRAPHRFARLHVQADRRFVEEEQARAAGDRDGELHLALLAAGKSVVARIGEGADAGERHRLVHRQRIAIGARGQRDVLARAQHRREVHVLHHHADAEPAMHIGRRAAHQFDQAFIGLQRAQPQAHRRRLAGAVRAEHRQQFAWTHGEIESGQRQGFAVALADAEQAGDRRSAGRGWNRRRVRSRDGARLPRISPPVQHLADETRPHDPVVAREQQAQRDGDDQRELQRPVQRPAHHPHLQAEDDRQMREIEPISSICHIPSCRAFAVEKPQCAADQSERPVADRQGVGRRIQQAIRRRAGDGERIRGRRRADQYDAQRAQRRRKQEIDRPLPTQDVQPFAPTMQQPAETEGGAVTEQRRQ